MNRRTEAKEATREKVMKAAGSLFDSKGYRRTTIRDIASRSGVSVGTVMAVGDKRTLLVALFDRAIAAVHDGREPAVDPGVSHGDRWTEQVDRLVGPFLNLFVARMDLAREYGAILMSGEHQSILFDDLAEALQAEIGEAARAAGMTRATSELAARTAYFAYLGTLFYWSARGVGDDNGPRDDFASALSYILSRESES